MHVALDLRLCIDGRTLIARIASWPKAILQLDCLAGGFAPGAGLRRPGLNLAGRLLGEGMALAGGQSRSWLASAVVTRGIAQTTAVSSCGLFPAATYGCCFIPDRYWRNGCVQSRKRAASQGEVACSVAGFEVTSLATPQLQRLVSRCAARWRRLAGCRLPASPGPERPVAVVPAGRMPGDCRFRRVLLIRRGS